MATPPKDEPLLDLAEIQGNVIPGFKKNHQHFVFFSITDAAAARTYLSKLHIRLSSAAEVFEAHRAWKLLKEKLGKDPEAAQFLFLNIALSASGLRKLTSTTDVDAFEDTAFKLGQAKRSTFIGDPASAKEAGHADGWLVGGPKRVVDGLLILASDDLPWLEDEIKKLEAELAAQGMKVEHKDRGNVKAAPKDGHEHFGFKDDISHPAVRGRRPKAPFDFVTPRTLPADKAFDTQRLDFGGPGNRLVWPGHFIFGYGRQNLDDPRTYEPSNQAVGPSWAKHGSLLVYRRLRQHTDVFWRFVQDAAAVLAKAHPKSAGGPARRPMGVGYAGLAQRGQRRRHHRQWPQLLRLRRQARAIAARRYGGACRRPGRTALSAGRPYPQGQSARPGDRSRNPRTDSAAIAPAPGDHLCDEGRRQGAALCRLPELDRGAVRVPDAAVGQQARHAAQHGRPRPDPEPDSRPQVLSDDRRQAEGDHDQQYLCRTDRRRVLLLAVDQLLQEPACGCRQEIPGVATTTTIGVRCRRGVVA
jgi:deferrochelatase/peroxidase EfeB